MAPGILSIGLVLAAAISLLMIGAVTAWSAANAARRLAGLVIAFTGAIVGVAALGGAPQLLIGALGVLFAHLVIGVALLVRLQEGYGGVETPEIDAADQQIEAAERGE